MWYIVYHCALMVVVKQLTLRPKKTKVELAFLVILSMWLSQLKLLWIFSPRYLAESVWFTTRPWMVYSLWIGDYLFVAMSTSDLSGLNLINQLFSHCCKLSKSLCRILTLFGSNPSMQKTVICKQLMKSRNKTMPWGTSEETDVAADDWPSSTTHCVRPSRKLVIQSWRWPLTP